MIKDVPSLLYGVKNTDLTDFTYKLHVLGGDYLRDAAHNLNILTNSNCPVYAALISEQHIWLDDASLLYRKGMDMSQRLFTSEFRNERAFLLNVETRREGHAYGDISLMDCGTLRRDVELRAPSPIGIVATEKDGTEKSVSFEEWADMGLRQKESLQGWRYQYFYKDEAEIMRQFCANVFNRWNDRAHNMAETELLSRINLDYMLDAQNYKNDMYRVPQEIAKQMLLYDDAPVYRLLPGDIEQVKPIMAIKTGLWFSAYREFAIAPKDWAGMERACSREAQKIVDAVAQRTAPDKPLPTHER